MSEIECFKLSDAVRDAALRAVEAHKRAVEAREAAVQAPNAPIALAYATDAGREQLAANTAASSAAAVAEELEGAPEWRQHAAFYVERARTAARAAFLAAADALEAARRRPLVNLRAVAAGGAA